MFVNVLKLEHRRSATLKASVKKAKKDTTMAASGLAGLMDGDDDDGLELSDSNAEIEDLDHEEKADSQMPLDFGDRMIDSSQPPESI